MFTHTYTHRQFPAQAVLCTLALSLFAPLSATAQSSFVMLPPLGDKTPESNIVNFELRPHCDSKEFHTAFGKEETPGSAAIADSACTPFDVRDPLTRQTPVLKEGDPLDLDVIVHNAPEKPLQRFRIWIAYDPTVLEGEIVEISKAYPTPTPGETDFSPTDGYIKLSGTADAAQKGKDQIVAHIRMHVLPTAQSSIPVMFYDVTGGKDSHTALFVKNGSTESPIATSTPGTLIIRITPSATANGGSGSASSLSSDAGAAQSTTNGLSSSGMTGQTSSAHTNGQASTIGTTGQTTSKPATPSGSTIGKGGVFDLLQVQHLRVTTEGSSVFLAWDVLPSAELVGYNVYYGTISGQYLQKRSIDKNSTTITIRALPTGATYYFAVRGVNGGNHETDFSQEVGISVGNPLTSTSPLTASSIKHSPKTPKTGGTITGDTGMPSGLLLFLCLSAVMGTGLAFRRQLSAKV